MLNLLGKRFKKKSKLQKLKKPLNKLNRVIMKEKIKNIDKHRSNRSKS